MSFEIESQLVIKSIVLELKVSLRTLKKAVSCLPQSTWRKHLLWKLDEAIRWKRHRESDSLTPFLMLVNFVKETAQEHHCSSLKKPLLSVQTIFDELKTLIEQDLL